MDTKPAPASDVPIAAQLLGYAGLLPQAIAVLLALTTQELRFVAFAAGYAYAAAIFAFLGGVWWGQSLSKRNAPAGAYFCAVLPSLIGVVLFVPWTLGWSWPDYSLVILGLLIGLSPLVDHALNRSSRGFLRLRWHLSMGLGSLTVALGVLAYLQV